MRVVTIDDGGVMGVNEGIGFIALVLRQQRVRLDDLGWRSPSPFCCVQAPVGAQVASPQSLILRWSKSPFPVSVTLEVYCVDAFEKDPKRYVGMTHTQD